MSPVDGLLTTRLHGASNHETATFISLFLLRFIWIFRLSVKETFCTILKYLKLIFNRENYRLPLKGALWEEKAVLMYKISTQSVNIRSETFSMITRVLCRVYLKGLNKRWGLVLHSKITHAVHMHLVPHALSFRVTARHSTMSSPFLCSVTAFHRRVAFIGDVSISFHDGHLWTEGNFHAVVQSRHRLQISTAVLATMFGDYSVGPHVLPHSLAGNECGTVPIIRPSIIRHSVLSDMPDRNALFYKQSTQNVGEWIARPHHAPCTFYILSCLGMLLLLASITRVRCAFVCWRKLLISHKVLFFY
jgi:hypothetical protein